jgi:hypothetical protein
MRIEPVEIFSDQTNAAILRHPGRKFPGLLLQGDTLHRMCQRADDACASARGLIAPEALNELNDLRNHLQSLLTHYKSVLSQHDISLPFSET